MYEYPDLNEISLKCQRMFNVCEESSGSLIFANPVGCWKEWADMCAHKLQLHVGLQIMVFIIILISIFSFVANTIVCIVFCLYDQLRQVKHYFVVNLAMVDNILVIIAVPMIVAYVLEWNINTPLCRAQIVIDVLCGTASIVSLAVISIERYIAVVTPLHYDSRVTTFRAILIIIFTWFYSLMVSFITLLAYAMPNSPAVTSPKQCVFFGGEFVIFIAVSSFVLPVAIMACAYWKIFLVAHVHAIRIQAMQVPSNNPEQPREGERQSKLKGELKAAKTLTIIMGTHIICWCPLFIYFLVVSFCEDCRRSNNVIAHHVILILRYCNTLANPIIYTGINRQFRAAIKKFVLRKRGNEDMSVTVYTHTQAT